MGARGGEGQFGWGFLEVGGNKVKVNPVSVIDEKLSQFLLNEQSL